MILSQNNNDFPSKLKQTKMSRLYLKGNMDLIKNKSVAIVGSRRLSEYGKDSALKFSKYLSKEGYTIISGLAIGVDSCAHLGALDGEGKTIAVLPSGINKIYPRENLILAERIVQQGGLLLSEYEDNCEVQLKSFPKRNELITLLSDAILIVEAGEKSGSTITARLGFKHRIPVFCVPGRIDDIKSKGTNLLLSQGANIAFNPQMIIDYLESEMAPNEIHKSDTEFEKLNDESDGIYGLINYKPKSIDEIAKSVELSIPAISERLLILEINGAIKKLPGEKYVLSN